MLITILQPNALRWTRSSEMEICILKILNRDEQQIFSKLHQKLNFVIDEEKKLVISQTITCKIFVCLDWKEIFNLNALMVQWHYSVGHENENESMAKKVN